MRDGPAKAHDRSMQMDDNHNHDYSPWWLLILVPLVLAALGLIIAFFFGWRG